MKTLFLALLIFVMFVIAIGLLVNPGKEMHPTVSSIGEKGFLESGAPIVPVAVTKEAFEQWSKARAAKDEYGQMSLLASGLIFTPESKTQVLIIDIDTFIRKVRILQGEYKGRSGWVAYEWIRP